MDFGGGGGGAWVLGAQEQWKCTPGNKHFSTNIFALTKRLLSHINKYISQFSIVVTEWLLLVMQLKTRNC